MKIVIAGAGISGLLCSILLGFHEVEIYERRSAEQLQGSGLAIWHNAVAALRRVGLENLVLEDSIELNGTALYRHDGRLLKRVILSGYSPVVVGVHRDELIDRLVSASDADISWGKKLLGPQPVHWFWLGMNL